jgi:hypothetical protein
MKFNEIVEHLGKRGFATRAKWQRLRFVYFGMDNIFQAVLDAVEPEDSQRRREYYTMCLQDIKADDWEIVNLFWDGGKDDFLPFKSNLGDRAIEPL